LKPIQGNSSDQGAEAFPPLHRGGPIEADPAALRPYIGSTFRPFTGAAPLKLLGGVTRDRQSNTFRPFTGAAPLKPASPSGIAGTL